MKEFSTIVWDANQVKNELAEFEQLLKSKLNLSEQSELSPFFKQRAQLSAFVGTYAPNRVSASQLAYEFPFLGDFAADIVVGNRDLGEYLVIELEEGASTSIFTKLKNRNTKEWSRRFDHGYSQLIDWFACLDDYRHTNKFKDEFGHGYVTFYGLLIVGRNAKMTEAERRRLRWRSKNVVVNSQSITCITYDDLYEDLHRRLTWYTQASKIAED